MISPSRHFLQLVGVAATAIGLSCAASAQTYPSRPVRWIVGLAPGGAADTVARVMAPWLSERLGQQIIIENKPGAGTNTASNAINETLYESLPFNFLRDIAPVAGLVELPLVMDVNLDHASRGAFFAASAA